MSKNFSTSTAALDLIPLTWNGFSYLVPDTSWTRLAMPVFTVDKVTSINSKTLRFIINGIGVCPAWLKKGCGVTVAALVDGGDVGGGSNGYVVSGIDSAGKYFDAVANVPVAGAYSSKSLDTAGVVRLNTSCQKAMLTVPAGASASVYFTTGLDASGSNPDWIGTIPAQASADSEYEITSPHGSKFDLNDFFVKTSGGAQSLMVRFL